MKIWEKYKKIVLIMVPMLVVAILGVLVGTMFHMQDKMTELGNQLAYLIDSNSILQSQVSNLQSNIEVTLEEEASLIEKQNVEVIDTNFATGTYQVKISVVPKEYSDSTKVSVFFGANEIPLTLNRYTYEGVAELSLSNNYDGNVTFLFVNGDKKNTEILKNYQSLQTKLENLLFGYIPEIPEYRDGKLYFTDEISYTLNAYESYGYESLELVLTADDVVLETRNLLMDMDKKTEASKTNGNGEAVAEGEVENTESAPESLMVYGISGETEFKYTCAVEEGQSLRLFLRAKCENGYTFEYDLFSAIVQKDGPNGFAETLDYFTSNYCIYDSYGNKLELH